MKSKLDCVHCDKTFSTSSNLLRHHRKVHKLESDTSKKICQCDLCGRRFSSVPCLRRHQRDKHAIINLVKCDKCKSSFRSTTKYDAHLQSCHLVKAVKNTLIEAHPTHSAESTKESSENSLGKQDGLVVDCDVKKQEGSLEISENQQPSVSTNHRDAIACKKCLLTFKRKSYLFAHVIKCKGPKKLKTCPISDGCHFKYRLNSTLRTHLKSVHDCDFEPEMQCKKCLLTFVRPSTLSEHVKMCKGPPSKKLLTCPVSTDCHFRARFKHTITLHLKKMHNFDIDPPREMKFRNWDEFMAWKKKEEESSGFCFTSQSGMKNGKSFFYCQKDGTDKPHTSMPRKTKRTLKKGRVKTGAFCSAYIRFTINSDDTVSVRYIPTHSHLVENIADEVSSTNNDQDTMEAICDTELEPGVDVEGAEIFLPNVNCEMGADEAVPEVSADITIASITATEANKSFGFKVHEDEMVTVLYLTSESEELPEGIFEYVNSTTSDGIHDTAVIEIDSADTLCSEMFVMDDTTSNKSNCADESTVAAVIEISNSQPANSEVAPTPDKTIWREKIKSATEDILTLLENDAVEERVLSSVLQSLQTCRNQIKGEINSSTP
ncbi:uncharacterized protein LOC117641357 [Thrips palmi]|uniref:Uncharacterized protein LOC117641357 n=1 Tax=Thrips palmi TaxID=161013 RepID=A0A6P8YDM2_THRPL|nr:uncharacterized protein LOC117641357 [Thrips palmi]